MSQPSAFLRGGPAAPAPAAAPSPPLRLSRGPRTRGHRRDHTDALLVPRARVPSLLRQPVLPQKPVTSGGQTTPPPSTSQTADCWHPTQGGGGEGHAQPPSLPRTAQPRTLRDMGHFAPNQVPPLHPGTGAPQTGGWGLAGLTGGPTVHTRKGGGTGACRASGRWRLCSGD